MKLLGNYKNTWHQYMTIQMKLGTKLEFNYNLI